MGRITISPHIRLYETIDELQKNLRFKDPENQIMLGNLMKLASRERGAWMNCEIVDTLSFMLLNGLVYTYLRLSRLGKRIEALEAKILESSFELKIPYILEHIPRDPDSVSSAQTDPLLPSFRQTGLDDIFQGRS